MADAKRFELLIDDPAARAELSAAALVEELFARIETHQTELNAFVTVMLDHAREDARRADRARAEGRPLPLDGLPLAVKDNVDVAAVPATCGSPFFARRIPAEDAEVVVRLRQAGAVVLGKTMLHEFAYGVTCNSPFFGACRNAWDKERIAGGSSGGSATAVAADLCVAAIGSDTGGSVRVPAALNGVAGLRPTYGLVSNRGVFPVSWSFDTVGPIARSVRDLERVLAVIAGYDPRDSRSVRRPVERSWPGDAVAGVTIGIPTGFFFEDLRSDIAACVSAAADTFARLGANVVGVTIPGIEEASEIWWPLIAAEARAVHDERFRLQPELFGDDVRVRLERGRDVTGVHFANAMQQAHEWRRRVQDVFERVDLILTPTVNTVAEPLGAEPLSTSARHTRLAFPWSLAHTPALSLPCGFSAEGLPVGVQLVAAAWSDAHLLAAGAAYQEHTEWHRKRPAPTAVATMP